MDVICTLHWLKKELEGRKQEINFSHINLIGESAGSQVGAMCLKLAPYTFSSFLDVSGVFLAEGQRKILSSLLTDPYVCFGDKHVRGTSQKLKNGCILNYSPKNPMGFEGGKGHSGAPLEDEVSIRDVGKLEESILWKRERVQIRSLHAIGDTLVPAVDKEKMMEGYRKKGADAQLSLITEDHVDGKLFIDTSHNCAGDRKCVYSSFGEPLWQRSISKKWGSDIGSDNAYSFPTESGVWTMCFSPEPTLTFNMDKES